MGGVPSATSFHVPCASHVGAAGQHWGWRPHVYSNHTSHPWSLGNPPLSCPAQRTPAKQFFPRHLYRPLKAALLEYGARELGCLGLSPIWLRWAAGAAGLC